MRFIRGICSLLSFDFIILGACSIIASFFRSDMSFINIPGILMIVLGVGINCMFSFKERAENRMMAARYFFVNGAIIFTYLTIVFFPVGKMIRNTLPSSFDAWVNGNLSGYKEIEQKNIIANSKYEIMHFLDLDDFED